jgi:hypothetical protein
LIDEEVVQIGQPGEEEIAGVGRFLVGLSLEGLSELVSKADAWISVDNFFPHFCHARGLRGGIVLWGKSDPRIFGYPENVNLLRDRRHLRNKQFDIWEAEEYEKHVFVSAEEVVRAMVSA